MINKNEDIKWHYIDDRKKEKFLQILSEKFSTIDLNEHPENILMALTQRTQEALEECFPLKQKSNRAKKRALTPWILKYTKERKNNVDYSGDL